MPDSWKDRLIIVVTSVFGSGYAPVASGTFGTAASIPLLLLCLQLPVSAFVLLVIAMIAFGSWLGIEAERIYGEKDSSRFVLDETVGYFITCFSFTRLFGYTDHSLWTVIILGFFLFRFFDVVKPWPANFFDKQIDNGVGVMLDDVVAGIYANLVMMLLFWIF